MASTNSSSSAAGATAQFKLKWLTPAFFDKFHDYWFQGHDSNSVIPNEEVIKRWFGRDDANDTLCREQYGSLLHEAQSLNISPTELVTPSETPLHALLLIILFDQIPRNIFRGQESQRCFNVFDKIALDISLRSLFPATCRSGEEQLRQSLGSQPPSTNNKAQVHGQDQAKVSQDSNDEKVILTKEERWYDHPSISLQPSDIDDGSTSSLDTIRPEFRYHLGYRMWFYLPLMHSESIKIHEWAKTRYEAMKKDTQNLPEEIAKEQKITTEETIKYVQKLEDFEVLHREIIERFGRYPHRNKPLGRQETKEEREYLDNGGLTFGSSDH